MSLISTLYFTSKNIKEDLSDLEQDSEAMIVDFSSRGISHSALMEDKLDLILPKDFSNYVEETLIDDEGEQLKLLSSNFIYDCADLDSEDLSKINEKINQSFVDNNLKYNRKVDIDDLPRRTRIIGALLLACSAISYFQYGKTIISIFFIVILIAYYSKAFKSYKDKKERQTKSEGTNFIPQLQDLISVCKQAKAKGMSVFHYWSL